MSQPTSAGFVDQRQVDRNFSRVAPTYGAGDFLVREVDRRMLERLDYVRLTPTRILDLGCSRGASLAELRQRYPDSHAIALDRQPAMLRPLLAQRRPGWLRWLGGSAAQPAWPIAADATQLPLASNSLGLVWSNLLLHWLDHPLPALAESYRVLEVGGLLMFSTFGPDTLKELRGAFADGYAHTQRFTDLHDLGDMLVDSGFADPVVDMEVITLTYDAIDALFADLRAAGGRCAMHARRHALTGKGRLAKLREAYENLRSDGKLPATFEVIYGHAWKVAPKQTADGRSIIRFEPRPKR